MKILSFSYQPQDDSCELQLENSNGNTISEEFESPGEVFGFIADLQWSINRVVQLSDENRLRKENAERHKP